MTMKKKYIDEQEELRKEENEVLSVTSSCLESEVINTRFLALLQTMAAISCFGFKNASQLTRQLKAIVHADYSFILGDLFFNLPKQCLFQSWV